MNCEESLEGKKGEKNKMKGRGAIKNLLLLREIKENHKKRDYSSNEAWCTYFIKVDSLIVNLKKALFTPCTGYVWAGSALH